MFSNQLSSRDLFSSSISIQDTSNHGEKDFSQLMGPQYEMSQYSQDFYSQSQCSGGSQSESQGQKVPVYEKYMSKPSLFRTNSQGRIPPTKGSTTLQRDTQVKKATPLGSFQQSVAVNKMKAKERDERDMLNSIVHIVRECSDEVKENLSSLKDHHTTSGESLNSSVKSLVKSVEMSTAKILTVVQSREEQASTVDKLQQELLERDTRIQQLQKQLCEARSVDKGDNSLSQLESLKAFLDNKQSELEGKLQKLHDLATEEVKIIREQSSVQRSSSEEQNKLFQDIKYKSQRQMQDMEKRVLDELILLRDDFERQKRDLDSSYRNQIQMIHQKQSRDLQQMIQRGIENSAQSSLDGTRDFYQQQSLDLKEFFKLQENHLEDYVKSHSSDQTKHYLKEQEKLYSKYQKEMQQELQKTQNMLRTAVETVEKAGKECQALGERPWQNESVPKNIQDQLDKLHNSHQAEIERLEKEIEHQRLEKEKQDKHDIDQRTTRREDLTSGMHNVYHIDTAENVTATAPCSRTNLTAEPLFQKSSGFLSPKPPQGTTWNSRTLFGRANPSPVATVLPQRQKCPVSSVSASSRQTETVQGTAAVAPLVATQDNLATVSTDQPRGSRRQSYRTSDISVSLRTNKITPDQTQRTENQKNQNKAKKRKGRKRKPFVPSKKCKAAKTQCGLVKIIEETSHAEDTVVHNVQPTRVTQATRSSSTVYDFQDEPPEPIQNRQSRTTSKTPSLGLESSDAKKWLAFSPTSSEGSQNSSPTMSLTDVFIRRKVVCGRRTPVCRSELDPVSTKNKPFSGVSDFLSTPNIKGTQDNSESRTSYAVSAHHPAEGLKRRSGERRKLCDFDTHILQIHQSVMQCTRRTTGNRVN